MHPHDLPPVAPQQADDARHILANPQPHFSDDSAARYSDAWARLKAARCQTIHRDRLRPAYLTDAAALPPDGDTFRHVGNVARVVSDTCWVRMQTRIQYHRDRRPEAPHNGGDAA